MGNKMTLEEKIKLAEDLISSILDNIKRDGLVVYDIAYEEFCTFNLKNQYMVRKINDYIEISLFGSEFLYSVETFMSCDTKNLIMDIFEESIILHSSVPLNYYFNEHFK